MGSKAAKIGPEVVRLRNEGCTFEAIAERLGTTGATASRAYKQFHAAENRNAVTEGKNLATGPKRRKISDEKINQIRDLLTQGNLGMRAIARPSSRRAPLDCSSREETDAGSIAKMCRSPSPARSSRAP
ncbi:hypothetical protein [Aporhodopirellula aestuarii]|uniref:Transposase IS30-like HTH domain-containing protein n=1 Tax=Aporhodopirellula aestuarii TaxID=2950107 RepID=A0ABT0UC46_9BACT|nr:hypothetical protein [Aporhodopirellula aestuarii]MCM2374493.1 hypothetical protein [Aporhodopirellula aestuarii]